MDVLHEAFKIAHTYTFLVKNFYGFETVFRIMILWFSSYFICVLCRAKILPQIYTRIIASLKPPPIYAHYTREKFRPDIYENCGAFGICASDWLGVSILVLVCITFCICGHRLDKVVFVDWLMSKFDCKSVMGLYKFIVKMWLCICNCMCICVCIWCWLWFCYRLNSVVIRL